MLDFEEKIQTVERLRNARLVVERRIVAMECYNVILQIAKENKGNLPLDTVMAAFNEMLSKTYTPVA